MIDNQESPSKELDEQKGGDLSLNERHDDLIRVITLRLDRQSAIEIFDECDIDIGKLANVLPLEKLEVRNAYGEYRCKKLFERQDIAGDKSPNAIELEALETMKLPCDLWLRNSFKLSAGCTVKTLFFAARNNAVQNQQRFLENCELTKQHTTTLQALDSANEQVQSYRDDRVCLEKTLERSKKQLDNAKAAISKMRILADEARGYITARPANKPKANMCLLKIQQMSIFPVEEEAEMTKAAKEFITELVASKKLDSALEALKYVNNRIFDLETGKEDLRNNEYLTDSRRKIKAALASIKDK